MDLFDQRFVSLNFEYDSCDDAYKIFPTQVTPQELLRLSIVFTFVSGKKKIFQGKDIAAGGSFKFVPQEKVEKMEITWNF